MGIKGESVGTVGELIDALSKYNRDQIVLGTWEGITVEVSVYQDDDVVLLDVDHL